MAALMISVVKVGIAISLLKTFCHAFVSRSRILKRDVAGIEALIPVIGSQPATSHPRGPRQVVAKGLGDTGRAAPLFPSSASSDQSGRSQADFPFLIQAISG